MIRPLSSRSLTSKNMLSCLEAQLHVSPRNKRTKLLSGCGKHTTITYTSPLFLSSKTTAITIRCIHHNSKDTLFPTLKRKIHVPIISNRNFSQKRPKNPIKTKEDTSSTTSTSSSTKKINHDHDHHYHYKQSLSAFIIGSIGGTCASLTGMGGAFIMIPLMTSSYQFLSMNLTQHVAIGTSLFAIATSSTSGAISYATSSKDAVDVESAICITLCAMVTARLGALYSAKLTQRTLKKILGMYFICASPMIPLKPYLNEWSNRRSSNDRRKNKSRSNDSNNSQEMDWYTTKVKDGIISGGIGLGTGFLSGLLGGGGGAIIVPALTLFTSMDHYMSLGTSLAAMILPAMVGTFTHYKNGNVNMRVAPFLALGSLVGAYAGGRVGVKVEEDKLKYGFSGLMFGLGVKTLIRG